MEPADRIVTFPRLGDYTESIKELFESFDLQVRLPPKTTERTVKYGSKYSADMMCFPYKLTLGNFIEALNEGANTLITLNGEPHCRFKHFYMLQEFALRKIGYRDFEMYGINVGTFVSTFRKLSGKSRWEIIKRLKDTFVKLRKIDRVKKAWSDDKLNIGIIGEPHCCWEGRGNYEIESKIENLGANPINTANFTGFLKERATEKMEKHRFVLNRISFLSKEKRPYREKAKKWFNDGVGGYALPNIYHLLWLIDKNIDGVVHVLPLCCTFETMIEDYVNNICKENNIPLLRIPVDETNAETNLETRVETFIKLIRRRKSKRGIEERLS